ncbi:DEAD/DEAH box helicase [Photobacterium kasasachensis]|uniref:DEAD/DEAH box helicase n=1 Tax=Photobacterium kasasachensis TaxID=2910240 RepID=UPI003D0E831E
MEMTTPTPENQPQHGFVSHLDDWIAYLCLLLDRCDDKITNSRGQQEKENLRREKVKYERQLRWTLGFRKGSNASNRHNLIISAIYADSYNEPQPVTVNEYTPILDCYQRGDHAFKQIENALNAPQLFMLQGPPGTGKTTAIVEIVLQALKADPDARILIASETHVAVDNAIDRLSAVMEDDKIPTVLRYPNFSKGYHFENPAISMANYEDKANKAWTDAYLQSPELTQVLWDRLATSNGKIPKWLGKNLADKHQIIGVTCNQMEHIVDTESDLFDLAIIDECSKATLPEWLMPLSIAKKAVLVGDHKQLPPTFCATEAEALSEMSDHQEKLIRDGVIDKLFEQAPEWMIGTLLTQYRMQPNIGELISEAFYNGNLSHGRVQTENAQENFGWLTYSTKDRCPSEYGAELANSHEVAVIDEALQKLAGNVSSKEPISVAVITPYRAQCRLLRRTLMHHNEQGLNLEIDTVDAFQGRQADAVFFSFVRNTGSAKFYGDPRRLNVALSRAKNHLYLVGCTKYIKQQRRHEVLTKLARLPVLTCYEKQKAS